ncbi:MAG: alpha/beta fold hydrolase [Tabrizicola sp.]
MAMFHHDDLHRARVPQEVAHRLFALGAGRPLKARVLPGGCRGRKPVPPPLVALHGISREALAHWQAFGPLAAAQGRALLVPRFDERDWPQFQQIGRVRPDLVLLDLLRQAGLVTQRVDLFGFSGGAQLAHRFAMLYPHRVATLHLAAPGWYTLPDTTVPWPLGLGDGPRRSRRSLDPAALSRLQLRQYLALKVRLWVGERDVGREASLRQTEMLDVLQGRTRLDRARRYADAFRRAALDHGLEPDIDLKVLPGCGHNFTDCARTGNLAARVLQDG